MIISVSRRTDIPTYYSEWFFNRIRAGCVLVRNPMNFHQISQIKLTPDVVDGIVFWTKNPVPMINRLGELKDYMYYFQFTITLYGDEVEPGIPDKNKIILPAFKRLSDLIGADRVIWRYDPIMISEHYSPDYHIRAFEKIVAELCAYTEKVTISFIDEGYRGVKSKELLLLPFSAETQISLSTKLAEIAHGHGLAIDTCAEKIDLKQFGIAHARCIDGKLLSKLLHCPLNVDKDKNQRIECGCAVSIDIGMYNTCYNGCRYCYANHSPNKVLGNFEKHSPQSPLISGEIGEGDKINERTMKSFRDTQTPWIHTDL